MPTRADMEAARPKCDRVTGAWGTGAQCGRSMRWVALMDPMDGRWICPAHGAMLTGREAAERAGYVAARIVEAA